MSNHYGKRAIAVGLCLLASLGIGQRSDAAEMDYRNWAEGAFVMLVQDLLYSEANLITLGDSSTGGIDQYGILIAEDADIEDGGEKNVVLFECGMHAREWFATESCYFLIDYLTANRNKSPVKEMLEAVDVWVIPQTNPAGRDIDDLALGDPTQFAYVCDSGTNVGAPCASSSDCPSGSCYTTGWRTNANTADCELGVDLARNFSSGWDNGALACAKRLCSGTTTPCSTDSDCGGSDCKSTRMQYHGDDPFSEIEALNLRRFIHNHMISTVVIVHANSHEIWNRWYNDHDGIKYVTDSLVTMNAAGSSAWSPDPAMPLCSVGGGVGQFSAWLTEDSDVSGELDENTERNISTFFFELPVTSDIYGPPYQNSASDASNGFHPSDTDMEDLWEDAIRDIMLEVIYQTASPQCPIDASGAFVTAECESDDFGIVGAKIASATDKPGLLRFDAGSRREQLYSGPRKVVYAVQNFGTSTTTTNATVTILKNGVVDATQVDAVSLPLGDRVVFTMDYTFSAGNEYRVELELDSDDFSKNNTKSFAFDVVSQFGIELVQFPGRFKLKLTDKVPGLADDRLLGTGTFMSPITIQPEIEGMGIKIHGRPPYIPVPLPEPIPVLLSLPSGSPWWDKSRPSRFKWTYTDNDGQNGPVQQVKIKQRVKPGQTEHQTKIKLKARNADLSSIVRGRSFVVEMASLADHVVFQGIAVARRAPQLPEKTLLPEAEDEEEPDAQPQQ